VNSGGIAPGDVSIALSPKLLDVLHWFLGEAEAACKAARKRQACNIDERFAQRVAQEARAGGALEFVGAGVQGTLPLITAGEVSTVLKTAGGVVLPIVGGAVTWKLLGKLQAFTLPASSVKGSGGTEDKDRCPADAPKGNDAVSSRTYLHQEVDRKPDYQQIWCVDNECKGDNKPGQKCKEIFAPGQS
jgi:hypothetical protein